MKRKAVAALLACVALAATGCGSSEKEQEEEVLATEDNADTTDPDEIQQAFEELAPHKICSFIYDLANDFNHFYHETKILSEEDADRKRSYIELLDLTREVLETSIDLLGFAAPERM